MTAPLGEDYPGTQTGTTLTRADATIALSGRMEPVLDPQTRDVVEISGVCRQQGCAML